MLRVQKQDCSSGRMEQQKYREHGEQWGRWAQLVAVGMAECTRAECVQEKAESWSDRSGKRRPWGEMWLAHEGLVWLLLCRQWGAITQR